MISISGQAANDDWIDDDEWFIQTPLEYIVPTFNINIVIDHHIYILLIIIIFKNQL